MMSLVVFCCSGCGYKMVGWSSSTYKTLVIAPVTGTVRAEDMKLRLRDALFERCLAGSGLNLVEADGHLILKSRLSEYKEQVIATDSDGRTRRLQFNMKVSFQLLTPQGQKIWKLSDYQYSDQYSITTSQASYRDEAGFVQDDAMRSIADLVISNITLAMTEWEQTHE